MKTKVLPPPVAIMLGLLLLLPSRVPAMLIWVSDNDSLVFSASTIVEAHVIGPHAGSPEWVGDDVKITMTYKGKFKPGDVCIVSGLDGYLKSWNGGGHNNYLGAGDDVVLFLRRDENPALQDYVEEAYDPYHAGVFWIQGNQAIRFHQAMDPGPLVADGGTGWGHPAKPMSLDDLRKLLAKKVPEMAELHRRLRAPLDVKEYPWLLQALSDQTGSEAGHPVLNEAAAAIGERIGRYHDPDLAFKALCINPYTRDFAGFASPKGREFLLEKINLPGAPTDMRATLLGIACAIGPNYQQFSDGQSGSRPKDAPFVLHNAFYIKRLVAAAILHAGEKRVWTGFADSLPRLTPDWSGISDANYLQDIAAAEAELKTFYSSGADDRQRYDIESIFSKLGEDAFDSLGAKVSSVDVAIDGDRAPYEDEASRHGISLSFEYFRLPWVSDDNNDDDATSARIIGRSETTGVEFEIRSGVSVSGEGGSGGYGYELLPANLAPGRYRVFARLYRRDKIVGESHGFEMDESGIALPPTTQTVAPTTQAASK